MEKLEEVRVALEKRGFKAFVAETEERAAEIACELVGKGSAGFGGSLTVQSLGLYERLREGGNALYWHWKDGAEAKRKAAAADWYICSANALTEDGRIVLTDGSGNRVAALSFGPKNALLVVGANKIVPDLAAAFERIKSAGCAGANAKRLGLNLPCTEGECTDCSSPSRICSVTAIFERPSSSLGCTAVILVGGKLGL